MCAAAVMPVIQRRGVKRHMDQLPDATVSELKRMLITRANEGYTESYGGKSHDHDTAPQSNNGIKPSPAVQMVRKVHGGKENLEGLQLCLLAHVMCEIIIILPDGQRHSMWLHKIQLQAMIVGCFKEVLKKLFLLLFVDYTKENVKVHCDGKALDDDSALLVNCGIKARSIVQLTRKVHGG